MTWNVENLYRPGGRYGPIRTEAYDRKLAALAAVIEDVGPDLVALQEVGDPEAVADLTGRLDGSWHTVLSQRPDPRGIRVGFLSRLPVEPVADTADLPGTVAPVPAGDDGAVTTRAGRGALAVRVRPGDAEVTAVTCHLKSKLLAFPAGPGGTRFVARDEAERARYAAYALYRRAAEAAGVRALVDDLLAGRGRTRPVVVLGDLNDGTQAATTQVLHGPPGAETGTPAASRPDRNGDGWRLWNLSDLIPEPQRWSRVYRGRREQLDHILVSHALREQVGRVGTVGAPDLASVRDDPHLRRQAAAPDHAPVVAELAV